jgi:hypothetical protein
MTSEVIQYASSANTKLRWGRFFVFGIILPLIALSFLYNGKFDSIIIILLFAAIAAGIGLRWMAFVLKRESAKSFLDAKRQFAKQGFNAELEHSPQLLIDSKAKKIAFVETGNALYDLYDLSDILGWEHQWLNKSKTSYSGLSGRTTTTKSEQANNVLVFKTNNVHKPLVKVAIPSYAQGELWMARLNALINS